MRHSNKTEIVANAKKQKANKSHSDVKEYTRNAKEKKKLNAHYKLPYKDSIESNMPNIAIRTHSSRTRNGNEYMYRVSDGARVT